MTWCELGMPLHGASRDWKQKVHSIRAAKVDTVAQHSTARHSSLAQHSSSAQQFSRSKLRGEAQHSGKAQQCGEIPSWWHGETCTTAPHSHSHGAALHCLATPAMPSDRSRGSKASRCREERRSCRRRGEI